MQRPLPVISIVELEQELHDETVFDEWETADTIEVEVPVLPPADDEDDGPTGIYEIGAFRSMAQVYWVQRG